MIDLDRRARMAL